MNNPFIDIARDLAKDFLEDFLEETSGIKNIIPIMKSHGDNVSEVISNYSFEGAKYSKIISYNQNWRNGIVALSILIDESNGNLRIFAYLSPEYSEEIDHENMISHVGLNKDVSMNLKNFEKIYSSLRANLL